MSPRWKSVFVALSIVVAALAMGLWLRNFDVSHQVLADLLARMRWWPVLPLFALLAGHVALSSWRWSLIEEALGGSRPPFVPAFATGAFALGLGTFLPSPVMNVACRGFANRISGTSGLRGAFSGGVDQVADLAAVMLLAIPAALAFLQQDVAIYWLGVPVAAVAGLAALMAVPMLMQFALRRWRFALLEQIAPLAQGPVLLRIYVISLARVVNLTAMTLAIHAMTGTASAGAVAVAVPLVTVAISAAMLPGAFGISEWSFSAVFAGLGVPRGDIVLFVLANRLVLTGLSLLLATIVAAAMAKVMLSNRQAATGEPA